MSATLQPDDEPTEPVLIGPPEVVVVPACVGNGHGHEDDQNCTRHGWALIDPGEDDPPVLETAHRDVADYVARLWNEDHA